MALTGRMRDFGISEILQLIGQQKKSGVLSVTDKTRKVEILFDQGAIVGASHEPPEPAFDLGEMLVRSSMISRSQLESARKEQQDSLKPLEQILISQKALDIKELRSMVTLSFLEIIYSLFLWKDGRYSFEAGSVSYPQQWTSPISSEQVLMDGYRIKDEWPLIEQAIPDKMVILRPAEGGEGRLDRESQRILRLVDGSRTVQDIVFLARAGSFETLKVLRNLIEGRRVEVAGAAVRPKKRNVQGLLIQAATALIVLAGLVAAGLGLLRNLERMTEADLSRSEVRSREALMALHKENKVAAALSLAAMMEGRYPRSLEELVKRGEIEPDDIRTAFGSFTYTVSEDGKACELSLAQGPSTESQEQERAGAEEEAPPAVSEGATAGAAESPAQPPGSAR